MSDTLTITPDMHRRAVQFLADQVLGMSVDLGKRSAAGRAAREQNLMPPNPARDVEEAAAQLGLALARRLAAGEVVPFLEETPHA